MINSAAQIADNVLGKRPVRQVSTEGDKEESVEMRAVTWQGARKVGCSMVPKPRITHPADVIVRITACTICSGSDLHLYNGEIPGIDAGFVLGHEGMGIIEQKGEAVKNFNVGDRVVIAFDIACGDCDACRRQEFTGCRETNNSILAEKVLGHCPAAIFGYSRLLGNVPGSQAEFTRVPFADVNCCKIPDEIPDEKALLMSDVACTSLHATELGEVKEGDTVVIWGLGPIGLCAAKWCKIKGAQRIIGIDLVEARLELAETYLGIETLNRTGISTEEVVNTLLSIIPGGADVCIEAVGFRFELSFLHKAQRAVGMATDTPEILTECFKVARPFGRISIIGDYVGLANHFPIGMITMKHLTIRSGQCPCQKYFPYVLEKIRDGTFDPSFVITHRINLQGIPSAYGKLDKKTDGIIKVFARP
jgi:threonine dehydrogenase-like Zn-dependent dehydrogenase